MRRILLLIMLACGQANADTLIQDGDYEPRLTIADEGLLMTGGRVDQMILWGDGPYDLQGGTLGRIELETGNLIVAGGEQGEIVRSMQRSGGKITTITFQGKYFRVQDAGRADWNEYRVEGWLSDGRFASMKIYNLLGVKTNLLPINFEIVPSVHPAGDFDEDWVIGLSDLNYVRNNFESVSLDDLNEIRNNFADGEYTLSLDDPQVTEYGSIPSLNTVPEPNTFLLALLLLPLLKGFLQWHTN